MNYFKIKLQFGEYALATINVKLNSFKQIDFLTSPAMSHIEQLTPNALPHLFKNVPISEQYNVRKLVQTNKMLGYSRNPYINHYIDLTKFDDFDAYLNKFSTKTRKTLARKVRKADNNGYQCKIYQQEDQIDEFHQLAITVGKNTYQNKLFDASIPDTAQYNQQMKQVANNTGFLGLILFYQEQPIAYLYCPIIKDKYEYCYLGYLQEHSKYSPGTVLQYYVIEEIFNTAVEHRAKYFDFTEGDGAHKALFATEKKQCLDMLFVENSVKYRFIFFLQSALDQLNMFIIKTLNRLKLKEKIKRLIRRSSTTTASKS